MLLFVLQHSILLFVNCCGFRPFCWTKMKRKERKNEIFLWRWWRIDVFRKRSSLLFGKEAQKPCKVCQSNRQEIFESDYRLLCGVFPEHIWNLPQCRKLAFRQSHSPFTITFSMVLFLLFFFSILLLLFFASFLFSLSLITDILHTVCNISS